MRARKLFVVGSIAMLALGASTVARDARADDAPSAADADAREKSRAAFRRGVAQARARDWSAARASFEAAWTYFQHPSILLNLGIARLHTDDPVRAEQDLVRFLSEDGGASQDELASAREALAEAKAKIGTLRIVVLPPSARVAIDGTAVETVRRADPAAPGVVAEVRATAGKHVVVVEADAYKPEQRDVDVAPKGEAVVNVALAPSEASKPARTGTPTRTIVGWSFVGLAGAALLTGGVSALRAKTLASAYSDPQDAKFQSSDARSEGIAFRTAADVSLGVALLSGAVAVVLLFTDLGKTNAVAARASALTW